MVLLNGRFSKVGFFLTQLCLDTPPWWSMKYWLWCSSIARKTMVEMLYGATWWDILQGWFLSFPMMSRYSTIMTNEIFPLMLLNCKKNNGVYDIWCSLMGDSPSLVSLFLNLSRHSTKITNEIFYLMILKCKKKNGGDGQWCSSMGDSPSLVSFLLNCV